MSASIKGIKMETFLSNCQKATALFMRLGEHPFEEMG